MSAPDKNRPPSDVEPDSFTLTREEERNLVERAQDGDRRAKGRLFRAHENWIWSLVNRWDVPEPDKADLFGAATLAWMQGLEAFDLDYGTRLLTYVSYHIWPAIHREHANLLDLPEDLEEVPLDAPVDQGEGDGMTEADRLEDPRRADDDLLREDLQEALEDVLVPGGPLRPQERTAVRLRYGLSGRDRPLIQGEIAAELGVTQGHVSVLLEKARLTLRDRVPPLRDFLEDVGR